MVQPFDSAVSPPLLRELMREALKEGEIAGSIGEIPVGAVIWRGGQIVGRGGNRVESAKCALGHAEIVAIEEASVNLGDWRLTESILCVTLEPCTMCWGAIRQSRIPVVAFAAKRTDRNSSEEHFQYQLRAELTPVVRVIEGIEERAALELLQSTRFRSR